jgi:hypothetical protein
MLRIMLVKTGIPKAPKRVLNEYARQALEDLAKIWKRDTLPLHFKPRAGNVYKYEPRTLEYNRYKKKRSGGVSIDLVYNGDAKKQILGDKTEAKSSRKRVTIIIRAPRHMFIKPAGWDHNPAFEVTKVLKREQKIMHRFFIQGITRRFNENKFMERSLLS